MPGGQDGRRHDPVAFDGEFDVLLAIGRLEQVARRALCPTIGLERILEIFDVVGEQRRPGIAIEGLPGVPVPLQQVRSDRVVERIVIRSPYPAVRAGPSRSDSYGRHPSPGRRRRLGHGGQPPAVASTEPGARPSVRARRSLRIRETRGRSDRRVRIPAGPDIGDDDCVGGRERRRESLMRAAVRWYVSGS